MKLKIYHIDAFTDTVFKGNYAAVIVSETCFSDSLMQSIATENNVSETAFAKPLGDGHYELRWFSPITEIDFCGHATLATAFVLFKQDPLITDVTFHAKAIGKLKVKKLPNGYIEMRFPNQKPEVITTVPDALLAGLSIKPKQVLINRQAYFAVYDTAADVLAVTTDLSALKQLAPYDVTVTACADSGAEYDFVSRYFWPVNGGDEDPVTGSIHTGLAPYWAEQLDKHELIAYQASARGGVLNCRVLDDEVVISGQAVQYLEGYIEV